jgi:hypothetical protein
LSRAALTTARLGAPFEAPPRHRRLTRRTPTCLPPHPPARPPRIKSSGSPRRVESLDPPAVPLPHRSSRRLQRRTPTDSARRWAGVHPVPSKQALAHALLHRLSKRVDWRRVGGDGLNRTGTSAAPEDRRVADGCSGPDLHCQKPSRGPRIARNCRGTWRNPTALIGRLEKP